VTLHSRCCFQKFKRQDKKRERKRRGSWVFFVTERRQHLLLKVVLAEVFQPIVGSGKFVKRRSEHDPEIVRVLEALENEEKGEKGLA